MKDLSRCQKYMIFTIVQVELYHTMIENLQ